MADEMRSEDEKKFAALMGRIFADEKFAADMEKNPAQALQQAGFQLDDDQRNSLQASGGDAALRIPTVRPVVRVLTRGTQPVVQVVTGSVAVSRVQAADDEKKR
jgi:hypothetical protein